MTNAHDDKLDSIALLALGVLSADEARGVVEHARTCAECRAEYAELRASADAVPFAAELRVGELDELSSARLKASVMNLVRASNGAGAQRVATAADSTSSAGAGVASLRARTAWAPYFVAAAAVVIAILSSLNLASLRSQSDRSSQQVAALQSQLAAQSHIDERERAMELRLAALTAPGSKHFTVPSGEVVTSGGRVYLALHVSQLAPGKVYQAWTLHAGAKAVAPSVTFVPEPGGIAFVELPESSNGLAAVAVSVEPAGGSKAPTSTPAFVRTLT
jgi:Anti-sigma-K factor rskA